VEPTSSSATLTGKGHFGTVRLATHKATGQRFACKSIAKHKLVEHPDELEDVKREVGEARGRVLQL